MLQQGSVLLQQGRTSQSRAGCLAEVSIVGARCNALSATMLPSNSMYQRCLQLVPAPARETAMWR